MGKNSFYDQIMKTEDFMHATYPCSLEEKENYPECKEYCNWHKDFFGKWSRNNFLTVMRYALPQRKLNLEPIEPNEKELAGIYLLGVKVRNMEMGFNTGGTWRRVRQ